ncbi:MAG TPA: hypothetical protein VK843_03190 [Planctomycetota bacterium]|nr:hypothetical protein [Planctomycetota bacterium]
MHTAIWIRAAALLVAVASPAQAGTWIVDAANGPGAHFTDIPPAIAAAVPGDLILVRAGGYSSFNLTEGLTILGTQTGGMSSTSINWMPVCTIAIPAGEKALLADLSFSGQLVVNQSLGKVVLDRVEVQSGLQINDCADIRLHRHKGGQVTVFNSHYEIASSSLIGVDGYNGGNGQTALFISGASKGILARSICRGGRGGDMQIGVPGDGGNGGHAVWVLTSLPTPTLLIAGGGVGVLQGGNEGYAYVGNPGGPGADLYNNRCGVWRSGTAYAGQWPLWYIPGPGSFDIQISPDDPTLEIVGIPLANTAVQYNVHASPGSVVRLVLGATPTIVPTPGVRVEKLVSQDQVLFLGVVPPSGVLFQQAFFRSKYTTGEVFFVQAILSDPVAGESRRTNSVPVILR